MIDPPPRPLLMAKETAGAGENGNPVGVSEQLKKLGGLKRSWQRRQFYRDQSVIAADPT